MGIVMTQSEMGQVRRACRLLAATETVTFAAVPELIGQARALLAEALEGSEQRQQEDTRKRREGHGG